MRHRDRQPAGHQCDAEPGDADADAEEPAGHHLRRRQPALRHPAAAVDVQGGQAQPRRHGHPAVQAGADQRRLHRTCWRAATSAASSATPTPTGRPNHHVAGDSRADTRAHRVAGLVALRAGRRQGGLAGADGRRRRHRGSDRRGRHQPRRHRRARQGRRLAAFYDAQHRARPPCTITCEETFPSSSPDEIAHILVLQFTFDNGSASDGARRLHLQGQRRRPADQPARLLEHGHDEARQEGEGD